MIPWQDEDGKPNPVSYAYDPRFVKIDDWYYVVWCDDMHGASIGLGKTQDFKTWIRLPNPLMPFNRNGVLFPEKSTAPTGCSAVQATADIHLLAIYSSAKVPTLSTGESTNT